MEGGGGSGRGEKRAHTLCARERNGRVRSHCEHGRRRQNGNGCRRVTNRDVCSVAVEAREALGRRGLRGPRSNTRESGGAKSVWPTSMCLYPLESCSWPFYFFTYLYEEGELRSVISHTHYDACTDHSVQPNSITRASTRPTFTYYNPYRTRVTTL
jgi:hypothetical protein